MKSHMLKINMCILMVIAVLYGNKTFKCYAFESECSITEAYELQCDIQEEIDRAIIINSNDLKETSSICASLSGDYYVISTSLSVRSGPGDGYAVIGVYAKGKRVEVYSISGGWATIKYNNGIGYVDASGLEMI